jgi:Glycosyltransferase Family 4
MRQQTGRSGRGRVRKVRLGSKQVISISLTRPPDESQPYVVLQRGNEQSHRELEKELQIEKSSVKIAQIAPLMESCPPRLYGGTERIVSYLTEELVRLGHDVTLFASGDSKTSARLEPFCENALRLDPDIHDPSPHHIVMLDSVRARANAFDVLHFHVDVLHYPSSRTWWIAR